MAGLGSLGIPETSQVPLQAIPEAYLVSDLSESSSSQVCAPRSALLVLRS
jgi:hypothetical protein